MTYISIDLGTTNIKVAAYSDDMDQLSIESENVNYIGSNHIVEFNAENYFDLVKKTVIRCCKNVTSNTPLAVNQITLTGQAESLIVVDKLMQPLRNGISWLDMRSGEECKELKAGFDTEKCYRITGQPEIIPTWPITKILWLKKNEPEIFGNIAKYLLLKDYIHYRLTGALAGEYSIYNFSHYFDITKKNYWGEILEYCHVSPDQLPQLVEPCSIVAHLLPEIAGELRLSQGAKINIGTLDHFAGMIGTGNISKGIISESTGTVLSIATMVENPAFSEARVPCHYGPFVDSYVLLPVCESGGISLEWFKKQFSPEESYEIINEKILKRKIPNELIFLPYITGVNAPDFNSQAKGVFYGIQLKHDKYDFAYAVMEGVAHLLKINIDYINQAGYEAKRIISTGGGAKSDLWSQIKANITGYEVTIPSNREAACLGAAIIGAVKGGVFSSYEEAIEQCVSIKKQFFPRDNEPFLKKHELYQALYREISPIFKLGDS